jgi:hypothetical protein
MITQDLSGVMRKIKNAKVVALTLMDGPTVPDATAVETGRAGCDAGIIVSGSTRQSLDDAPGLNRAFRQIE